jgi:hypothetical protein
MVNDIITTFYYYTFHFCIRYSYFWVFENILEALLIPWNAVLTLLAGFGAVSFIFHLITFMRIVLVRSQALTHKNAPGKLLSIFHTRMDTRKRNPLESSLISFQTL